MLLIAVMIKENGEDEAQDWRGEKGEKFNIYIHKFTIIILY